MKTIWFVKEILFNKLNGLSHKHCEIFSFDEDPFNSLKIYNWKIAKWKPIFHIKVLLGFGIFQQ
jgi:hypothetical protein